MTRALSEGGRPKEGGGDGLSRRAPCFMWILGKTVGAKGAGIFFLPHGGFFFIFTYVSVLKILRILWRIQVKNTKEDIDRNPTYGLDVS